MSQVNIVGATEVEVTSGGELTGRLEEAARHRLTAPTFKNDTSSRSHAVCKIRPVSCRICIPWLENRSNFGIRLLEVMFYEVRLVGIVLFGVPVH